MFDGVTAAEYNAIYRRAEYLVSQWINPRHFDKHELIQQAVEIFFERGRKAPLNFCVSDAFRKQYGRNIKHRLVDIQDFSPPSVERNAAADYKIDLGRFLDKGKLNKQQLRVLGLLYDGLTMKEVGDRLEVSESRICQIVKAMGLRD